MDELFSPIDSGPIYKETILGRWPVEPWNTVTTVFFLIIVIYWYFKIRQDWRRHKLIFAVLPLIGIGALGGFLYHSYRNNIVWLLMDWLPIVINANVATIYFWRALGKRWDFSVAATYLPLLVSIPMRKMGQTNMIVVMSVSYGILALSVILPLFLYTRRMNYRHGWTLMAGVISISLALFFRTFDSDPMMAMFPMGTHFLWHTFGAFTCYFVISLVYKNSDGLAANQ